MIISRSYTTTNIIFHFYTGLKWTFSIIFFTILKEPRSKCLKNCFLDLENSQIRVEPPPPTTTKTRINTTEIFGPQTSSSYYKRLVAPNMKTMNGWNHVNSKLHQIQATSYKYYYIRVSYIVLKNHRKCVLWTRIGGSFHSQGARSYHDTSPLAYFVVMYGCLLMFGNFLITEHIILNKKYKVGSKFSPYKTTTKYKRTCLKRHSIQT